VGESELDSSGSGKGPLLGSYEHGNEPSCPIIGVKLLDYLSDYQLLKKVCVSQFVGINFWATVLQKQTK
jgi:hypothetical protein